MSYVVEGQESRRSVDVYAGGKATMSAAIIVNQSSPGHGPAGVLCAFSLVALGTGPCVIRYRVPTMSTFSYGGGDVVSTLLFGSPSLTCTTNHRSIANRQFIQSTIQSSSPSLPRAGRELGVEFAELSRPSRQSRYSDERSVPSTCS